MLRNKDKEITKQKNENLKSENLIQKLKERQDRDLINYKETISYEIKTLSDKHKEIEAEKDKEIESLKTQLKEKDLIISDLKMRLSTSIKAYTEYIGNNRMSIGSERQPSFNKFMDTHDPSSGTKKKKTTSIMKTTTT